MSEKLSDAEIRELMQVYLNKNSKLARITKDKATEMAKLFAPALYYNKPPYFPASDVGNATTPPASQASQPRRITKEEWWSREEQRLIDEESNRVVNTQLVQYRQEHGNFSFVPADPQPQADEPPRTSEIPMPPEFPQGNDTQTSFRDALISAAEARGLVHRSAPKPPEKPKVETINLEPKRGFRW